MNRSPRSFMSFVMIKISLKDSHLAFNKNIYLAHSYVDRALIIRRIPRSPLCLPVMTSNFYTSVHDRELMRYARTES